MDPEDRPIVGPGRITLAAIFYGVGYMHTPKGYVRFAALLNVRFGDRVIMTEAEIPFPKKYNSDHIGPNVVLQFVANVTPSRKPDGWHYKLGRCSNHRILPPSKGGRRSPAEGRGPAGQSGT